MYKVITTYVLASLVFVGALFGMSSMTTVPDASMNMSHIGVEDCSGSSCETMPQSCAEHCFVQAVQDLDVLTLVAPAVFAVLAVLFVLISIPVLSSDLQPVSVRLDRQRARILSTQKRE